MFENAPIQKKHLNYNLHEGLCFLKKNIYAVFAEYEK